METTMPRGTMHQVMTDAAVDTSLNMTAKMTGLSKDTTTKVVQAGLPVMAKLAHENPQVLTAIYAQSVKALPEPAQAFYTKLGENPQAQQAVVTEFKTWYGPMTEALNREAASQAGTTEAQAGKVLAATFPAVAHAMRKEHAGTTEVAFGQWLQGLVA